MNINHIASILLFALILISSCTDDQAQFDIPATYDFNRNGKSTVDFSGQTTRIAMAEELVAAMKDFSVSEESLIEMYRNESLAGGDANPWSDSQLNNSTKSIKSKVAASADIFSGNTVEANELKNLFESWLSAQVDEVFPNEETVAAPGIAGQIADGTSTRYINEKGVEYDQYFGKSLIGGLMLDQMINNYLGVQVLDIQGNAREDNDNGILSEGNDFTTMEHKWDEAYGYLFGASENPEAPMSNFGLDDSFLNKYIGRVNDDEDFNGIGQTIFDAFKKGRAAIVAKEYEVRDEQVDILREALSKSIAIRTVYYLQQGKINLPAPGSMDFGPAFHDLSEGLGFIQSLRFCRSGVSNETDFTKEEVNSYIDDLLNKTPNGLWDVNHETLDLISESIASKYDFTVEEAAE